MTLDCKTYDKIIVVGCLNSDLYSFVSTINDSDTLYIITGNINLGLCNRFIEDLDIFSKCEHLLSQNNNTLCIIRGNYDNSKFFKKGSSFKDLLMEECPHIFLISDYSTILTKTHNILCIGGGRSLNRISRIKDFSYFNGENVNKPVDNFYENIEYSIDTIISFSSPLFAYPYEFTEKENSNTKLLHAYSLYDTQLTNELYRERLLLKGIYEKLNNKHKINYWIYSKYNISNTQKYNKTKFISLLNKEKFILP